MSDRPMLLKYLTTKMKIILCIFLLCITVSVFGQSQELNGVKNKSIEFPAAVETGGSLMYGSKVIGRILGGKLLPLTTPEYQGRVQWDKSTGLFSLSRLRLEDSGVYTVESDGLKSVSFNLTVSKDNVNVSKPHVSITRNEYPCTIECTAERGTGVTLSWYREGEEKPYVSSRVASAPHLHLPKTVARSGTYTCEAKNSVSNEKASITVGAHCTAPTAPSAPSGSSAGTIAAIIFAAVAFPSAVVLAVLFWLTRSKLKAVKRDIRELRGLSERSDKDDSLPPRSYIINQSDEPEDETPQTRSLTINPQP